MKKKDLIKKENDQGQKSKAEKDTAKKERKRPEFDLAAMLTGLGRKGNLPMDN